MFGSIFAYEQSQSNPFLRGTKEQFTSIDSFRKLQSNLWILALGLAARPLPQYFSALSGRKETSQIYLACVSLFPVRTLASSVTNQTCLVCVSRVRLGLQSSVTSQIYLARVSLSVPRPFNPPLRNPRCLRSVLPNKLSSTKYPMMSL